MHPAAGAHALPQLLRRRPYSAFLPLRDEPKTTPAVVGGVNEIDSPKKRSSGDLRQPRKLQDGPSFELQANVLSDSEEGQINAIDVELDCPVICLWHNIRNWDARFEQAAILSSENALHDPISRRPNFQRHLPRDLRIEPRKTALSVREIFLCPRLCNTCLFDAELGREFFLLKRFLAFLISCWPM